MFVIDSVSSVCLVLELTTSRGQKRKMNEKSSFFKKWLMDDDTDDDDFQLPPFVPHIRIRYARLKNHS